MILFRSVRTEIRRANKETHGPRSVNTLLAKSLLSGVSSFSALFLLSFAVTRLVMVVSHKSKSTRQPKGKDCCILFKDRLEHPDIVNI